MKKRLKETLKTQIAARANDDEPEHDEPIPTPAKSSSSRKKTSDTPKRGSARKATKKATATERLVYLMF